jgi:hypothetical protein
MAVEAHIAELTVKHQRLEERIREELQHPSSDDLNITELKREKLRLKDEIERLRQTTIH